MREHTVPSASSEQTSIAYLVFELGGSEYAIDVGCVREIISDAVPSPVPGAPDYLMGVINLRGKILPMVDLRGRFRMKNRPLAPRDCFVILTTQTGQQVVELGIRVDAVCDVQRISEDNIECGTALSEYSPDRLAFRGVAKTEKGVRLLLDSSQLIEQLRADVRVRTAAERPDCQLTTSSAVSD